VRVFVGDQADRSFWSIFRKEVPSLDVIIDDGGHKPEQQVITLEEMLPHLRPGGVYACEDVHGTFNHFASYVHGIAHNLNAFYPKSDANEPRRVTGCTPTPLQSAIHSVHLYPFMVVIEKNDAPVEEFIAPRHGTQWQPFL
jgi:hypothetical protein